MENYLYQDLFELEEKHWWHLAKRSLCVELINSYIKRTDLKILDIGCGTGRNMQEFARFGIAQGVDQSQEAINFCKKRGLTHVQIDKSEHTDFKEQKFDLVTMLDVLEHTDDEMTIAETARILKSGGYLLITVPAFQWLWSRWDVVLHHKRRYTVADLTRLLEKHGLSIVKASYAFSFLVLPILMIRLIKSLLYKKDYPSDFKISSPLINRIGLFICSLERWFIFKTGIPIGTSVICLARKI